MADEPVRRDRWPSLVLQSTRPTLILSPAKRIRAVNAAWESLTGLPAAEALGLACLRKGPTDAIVRAFAPPASAKQGVTTVRHAQPGQTAGPPWWDVTFVPLPQAEGPPGYLVIVDVVAAESKQAIGVLPDRLAAVRHAHQQNFTPALFSGTTATAKQFEAKLTEAAKSLAPVWLTGEAGSGKETAARVIHAGSAQRDRAFFGLDGAASPGFLAESILFGRGSFGESGHLGTLYLKDPQCLPGETQSQLLAWLEGPGRSVRVMVGSRRSAADMVAKGELSAEFQTRFAVIELAVPPLRERAEGYHAVFDHTAKRFGKSLANETRELLAKHPWPGNVRELADVLGDIEAEGPIKIDQLPRSVREKAQLTADPPPKPDAGPKLDDILIQVERRMLLMALKQNHGNATKAAEWLGIPRTRFLRRAESLGVSAE